MQEAVDDGASRGHIAEQLAPFFQGPVAGHNGGFVFVAPHDDFQQVFAGVFWQLLEPHVINDNEVRLQVSAEGLVLLVEGFVFHEVAHQIEDGAIEHEEVLTDGLVADGLGQMGFADAGRAEEQHVFGFADKPTTCQLKNLLLVDGEVEAPVKIVQRFQVAEVRQLGVPFHQALLADVEFVLTDEFEELGVAETIGGGFLQAHVERLDQAGEAELF